PAQRAVLVDPGGRSAARARRRLLLRDRTGGRARRAAGDGRGGWARGAVATRPAPRARAELRAVPPNGRHGSLLQHPGAVFPVVRSTLPPRVRDDCRARGVRPVRGTAGGDRRATDAATGTCHGDNLARRARPGGAADAQLAVARGV